MPPDWRCPRPGFRRRVVIGSYIADVVCPSMRLVGTSTSNAPDTGSCTFRQSSSEATHTLAVALVRAAL